MLLGMVASYFTCIFLILYPLVFPYLISKSGSYFNVLCDIYFADPLYISFIYIFSFSNIFGESIPQHMLLVHFLLFWTFCNFTQILFYRMKILFTTKKNINPRGEYNYEIKEIESEDYDSDSEEYVSSDSEEYDTSNSEEYDSDDIGNSGEEGNESEESSESEDSDFYNFCGDENGKKLQIYVTCDNCQSKIFLKNFSKNQKYILSLAKK